MSYIYSAENGAFYNNELVADYRSAETWPDNYVNVLDEDYVSLMEGQSDGKIIISDKNGYPVLAKPPTPTYEERVSQAIQQKNVLMKAASDFITPLEDAAELGIATVEEAAALQDWKRYRVMLNRVDVRTAPDIQWPERPA
ncbi:tail fiber assembly protein [Enterobacter cloacae]|uniref:tail fiber assembly protein n=1 Tax=Enterobacter cloacae TaxID=550 RepID=UPI00300E7940